MAVPFVLKTPTNAYPLKTDKIVVTALANILRAIKVPRETGALVVTVTNASGIAMAFHIQGDDGGTQDGDALTHGVPRAAGANWAHTVSGGGPTRAKVIPQDWYFYVSGVSANPVIRVESSLHPGI